MHENLRIPALLPLNPISPFGLGKDNWRGFFPFTEPSGSWAFSGRVALNIGLRQIALKPGRRILVPSYFQGSEIDTLLRAGFKLIFYRLQPDFKLDLNDVEAKLTPDVSALYIIHYFGLPQPMSEIRRFCKLHSLPLIEDCALSLFSKDGDRWLGSDGEISFFSVYKTMPLPHGGYLVTKSPRAGDEGLTSPPLKATLFQTADLIMMSRQFRSAVKPSRAVLRNFRRALGWRRDKTIEAGGTAWDSRLLNHSASSMVGFLMRSMNPSAVIRSRRDNFSHLHSILKEYCVLPIDRLPDGACPLFYPIAVADKVKFQLNLARQGIGSVNLWSDNHPACPVKSSRDAGYWRRHILELPVHQLLNQEDMEDVGRAVRGLMANAFRSLLRPAATRVGRIKVRPAAATAVS